MRFSARRVVPDPAVWSASSFASPAVFTVQLTEQDRAELLAAVRTIERTDRLVPTHQLSAADFAFGALEARLRQAFEEVRSGRGFVLLRGLPRHELDLDQFAAVVWGIGTRFGRALSQNAQGELLGHVIDATAFEATPRMYRSALELGLHNDVTAMLSLACWQPAKSGGESRIASAVRIHDEIARRAPRLLEPLYRGFHYHRLGEEGPNEEPVTPYRIPIFAVHDGHVSCRNARAGYIAGHHELGIPITDTDIEAIDLFDAIAREPESAVTCSLDFGDMLVINNYTVLHARRAFEEFPEPERRRHLLRLWLDAEGFRDVPKEFNQMSANGIPYQAGRSCTYDFQKLFREVDPRLLGFRPSSRPRTSSS
jgi:alpha-ketoglutarate-dependent taurine dioxygenase